MLCSLCHENESVLFIEQSNIGPKKKLNLCVDCARQYGITPDSKNFGKAMAALYDAFLNIDTKENEEKRSPDSKKLCPVCGVSLYQIRKTRRTGCPECYEIFKNEINDISKSLGISFEYNGSFPKRIKKFDSILTKRLVIKGKLEESLKNEDYEKAAIYRDYLRALEKTPVSGGDDE